MKKLPIIVSLSLLVLLLGAAAVGAGGGRVPAVCMLHVPVLDDDEYFKGYFPIPGEATVSGNGRVINANCKAQVPDFYLQDPDFFPGPPDVDNNGHWLGANSCMIVLLGTQIWDEHQYPDAYPDQYPATSYSSVLTPAGQFNVSCQYKD